MGKKRAEMGNSVGKSRGRGEKVEKGEGAREKDEDERTTRGKMGESGNSRKWGETDENRETKG